MAHVDASYEIPHGFGIFYCDNCGVVNPATLIVRWFPRADSPTQKKENWCSACIKIRVPENANQQIRNPLYQCYWCTKLTMFPVMKPTPQVGCTTEAMCTRCDEH